MIKLKPVHIAQISNTLLRLVTLAAKLGLTLYMGRYFNFADIGAYGLVFGAVMVMTAVLGLRTDYAVSREIVGVSPAIALAKMRDQAVFFGLNYLVFAIVMIGLMASHATNLSNKIMFMILMLSVLESFACTTDGNMNSMGRPLFANVLFFIRSGSWALVVVLLGFLVPAFRTADAVLIAWVIGATVSLVVNLWAWRHLPWREVMKMPVDWSWVKKCVTGCFFLWLGGLGGTAGFYADRFIVAHKLGLDMAGVATFYASFTGALLTLVQSGVLSFAYPRLIMFHRENDREGFWHEARKSAWHVALFAGVIAVGVGICVPLFGSLFHRQILVDQAPTLWLMLIGMWMQCNAFTLHYILFARHQDRAIWLGNLLFLIPAFGCNAILVPWIGFIGIGYGSVISALFIMLWRLWHVRVGSQKHAVA